MNNKDKNISQEYFDEVHKYTLELIDFVDKVCEENNIKYTLDCGTLIGAIRHKGFIPWDDDADISFTRENYDKFLKVIKNTKLPDNIKIYEPSEEEHFFDFNVRLYNTKKSVRDNENNKSSFGGFYQYAVLDMYIYDNFPDTEIKRMLYVLKLQFIFGLAMSRRYHINYKKYKTLVKIVIFFLSKIGRFFNLKNLILLYDKIASAYKNVDTKLLYSASWQPQYPGWRFDKNDFKEYIKIDFEGKKYLVLKEYDKILKYGYGDYMTPKETHHHMDVIDIMNTNEAQVPLD